MPRYSYEVLAEAAAASTSVNGVLRYLDIKSAGGSHQHISRRLKQLNVDTSHLKGQHWAAGTTSFHRKSAEEILIRTMPGSPRTDRRQLRRALQECGVIEECVLCGVGSTWNDKPLTLQIDHVDGDWNNNEFDNLRYVCPNCHTQLETSQPNRLRLVA